MNYKVHKFLEHLSVEHTIADNLLDEVDSNLVFDKTVSLYEWYDQNDVFRKMEFEGINLFSILDDTEFHTFMIMKLREIITLQKILENKSPKRIIAPKQIIDIAQKLVSKEMVDSMKPGAIVIDLAVETGGNCEYSKKNQIEEVNGVKIVGYDNLPSTLARDSSSLFAKNLLNFLSPHVNKENKTIDFDWEDETVKNTLVTKGGEMVNELLKDK